MLSEDGVIFISIDDNEVENLRKICDEVFGETNFIGNIIIQTATDNNPRQITTEHEYIICYAKNSSIQKPWIAENEKAELIQNEYLSLKKRYGRDIDSIQKDLRSWIKKNANKLQGVTHYDNVDEKGVFHDGDIANTIFGGYQYDVIHPLTHKPCKRPEKGWRFSEATMKEMISNNDIMFGADETTLIKPKKRLENAKDVLRSVIYEDGRTSTKQFESLMARDIFQNPKSATILQRLISFIVKEGDIVLDFFSGSATTAEALFRFEVKEKIAAHFILVQIRENLDESLKGSDSRSKKTIQNAIRFLDSIKKPHNICEIGEERIRRAGKKIKEEMKAKQPDLFTNGNDDKQPIDTGFRVFRIDSSNMKDVYFAPKDLEPQQLELFADNVKEDRTELDLLYGCMVDWGVQLSLPLATEKIDGMTVYTVNDGDLVACFGKPITDNVVKAMADKAPLRVLFRDSCFEKDEQKINIFEQFKQLLGWSDDEALNNIRVI
jgi:adenine-specific DNA-methyltransferase